VVNQIEAIKFALEALDFDGFTPEDLTHRSLHAKAITAIKQALAAPVQEPVACAVCNEVHAILDADESKIIRDAKDGYPDGRTPRILTLQERVTALCVYASDWKRWCLEKENTTPPAAQRQWVGLTSDDVKRLVEQARQVPADVPCPDYNERLLALADAELRENNTP
jgi:hypothetical protein